MSLPKGIEQPIEFTQRMTLHLNGGSNFSELHYDILADGVKIGTRHTRTDGSPKYNRTADIFQIGDEKFDVMETKGEGMVDWLTAQAKKVKS